MALKMIDHGSKEYQQMVNLRYNILRKPLGLNFTPEELEKEKNNVLIGAFEEDQLLGCCMLVKQDNKFINPPFESNASSEGGFVT